MSVAFVFTNPRHHLEMMAPVVAALARRGIHGRLISLAELRGFETPRQTHTIERVIPLNLRPRVIGRHRPNATDDAWQTGGRAKKLVWALLRLRMRQLLRGVDVVVVPNDAVYPYSQLISDLHTRDVTTVLLQEGIRFPLPVAHRGPVYGAQADIVCAWGEGSKDYFVATGVSSQRVYVTGAPRFDALDPAEWTAKAAALLQEHNISVAPLVYLSNPIEHQGYGDKQLKLKLFGAFLREGAEVIRAHQVPVIVKNHLAEDPEEYKRVASASSVAEWVHVLPPNASIFATLAAARAVVVLTSTTGLEALVFDRPLAQMAIPHHPPAFEYAGHKVATVLEPSTIAAGLRELFDRGTRRDARITSFVARHLHDRGNAADNVAKVVLHACNSRRAR
ncbi:MAG: hypothetical protein AB7R00_18085 [Kofleriaceae bacterium]